MKRIISIIIVIALIIGMIPSSAMQNIVYAEDTFENSTVYPVKGTCGDNLTWELTQEGILTISGTGDMYDYDSTYRDGILTTAPWGIYETEFKTVIIDDGVTSIGAYAFYFSDAITGQIVLPESVTSIGEGSFNNVHGLERLTILNPNCIIGNSVINWGSDPTVFEGYFDSTAYEYAKLYKIHFSILHDHVWDEGLVIKKAKCEETGNIVYECITDFCDEEKEEIIPPEGHSFDEWEIEEFGSIERDEIQRRDCINCNAYENRNLGKNLNVIDAGFCGRVDVGVKGSDLIWTLTIDGTLTISGCGDMKQYTHGSNYVTSAPWGDYITEIKALVLEEGIKYIGASAFAGCKYITGPLNIPDTVELIDGYAFYGCSGFTGDLVIPDSVETVHWEAFRKCKGFDGTLTLSKNMDSICSRTFEDCVNLKGDLIIPENITSISDSAFCNCRGFDGNLLLHDNIESIGEGAFYRCSSLKGELYLPKNITIVNDHVFENCTSITGILDIPEGITSIGELAFANTGIENLVLPESLIEIKDNAFNFCQSLTGEIVIPQNVISVGKNTFRYDDKISEIQVMNPECILSGSGISESVVIVGHADSTAKIFADDNGCVFRCFNHSWSNEYAVDWASTCKKAGQKSIHCNICNSVKEGTEIKLELDSNSHIYQSDKFNATCENNGYILYTCVDCEYSYKKEDAQSGELGHDETWNILIKPSCVDEGLQECICSRCGISIKTETIPPLEHDFSSMLTSPDCVNHGYTTYSCKNCTYSYKVDHPDDILLEHTYGEWVITVQPSCTTNGLKIRTCTRCRQISQEEIIYCSGHDYSKSVTKASCVGHGYTTYSCKNCIDEYQIINWDDTLLEHTYGEWEIVTSPTCSREGYKKRICTRCKSSGEEAVIPTLNHDYSKSIIKPTCATKGYTINTCQKCGYSCKTDYVKATSLHKYAKYIITKRATTKISGSQYKKCKVCGTKVTKSIPKVGKMYLSTTNYVYDGKKKNPIITVKNINGDKISSSNYKVKFSSSTRKAVGTYKVTITFNDTSKYKGTLSKSFKINPNKTKITALTAGNNKFTVKWEKKQVQVTGYQVRYSLSSKFKSYKQNNINSNKMSKKTFTGLKNKKTYYVKVRTYKTVNGIKYYSKWSSVKKVKTK